MDGEKNEEEASWKGVECIQIQFMKAWICGFEKGSLEQILLPMFENRGLFTRFLSKLMGIQWDTWKFNGEVSPANELFHSNFNYLCSDYFHLNILLVKHNFSKSHIFWFFFSFFSLANYQNSLVFKILKNLNIFGVLNNYF